MAHIWEKGIAACLLLAAAGLCGWPEAAGPSAKEAVAKGLVQAATAAGTVQAAGATEIPDRAPESGPQGGRRVILLLVDRLRAADVADGEILHLRGWTRRGGIGLMNVNAGGNRLRKPVQGGGPSSGADRVTVLEWGQLAAVEKAKGEMTATAYRACRQQALAELDRLVGKWLQRADAATLVIVASTGVGADNQTDRWNRQLVPVLMAGGAVPPASLLTSASTRRAGIVTDLDVAATIQEFLGRQPAGWAGRMVDGVQPDGDVWEAFASIAQQTHRTYARRRPVLTLFGAAGAVCFLGMAALLLAHRRCERMPGQAAGIANGLVWASTGVLAAPAAFLLLPLVEGLGQPNRAPGDWSWLVLMPLLWAGITWGLMRIRRLLQRLFVLACGTVGLVVFDAAAGARLAQGAILSYDPVVGARYYGVGNEYMACTVAWLLLACGYLLCLRPGWRRKVAWVFPLFGAGLVWFFASPELGANAGGTVTAATAVVTAAAHWGRWPKRVGWPLGIAVVAGAVGLLFGLHEHAARPTHVSFAAELVRQADYRQISGLVVRKLRMNWQLIRDYAGAPLLVVLLFGVAVSIFRSAAWMTPFLRTQPGLRPFVNGVAAGALAGFAANDSGVVVAALMLLPLLYTLCLIRLVEVFPTPHTTGPAVLLPPDTPDPWRGPDPGR